MHSAKIKLDKTDGVLEWTKALVSNCISSQCMFYWQKTGKELGGRQKVVSITEEYP